MNTPNKRKKINKRNKIAFATAFTFNLDSTSIFEQISDVPHLPKLLLNAKLLSLTYITQNSFQILFYYFIQDPYDEVQCLVHSSRFLFYYFFFNLTNVACKCFITSKRSTEWYIHRSVEILLCFFPSSTSGNSYIAVS